MGERIMCDLLLVPGDMENELDVLEWMIGQKTDESIELISRDTLFTYINTKDFLAVIFCETAARPPEAARHVLIATSPMRLQSTPRTRTARACCATWS